MDHRTPLPSPLPTPDPWEKMGMGKGRGKETFQLDMTFPAAILAIMQK
jgi:hypothetical protein